MTRARTTGLGLDGIYQYQDWHWDWYCVWPKGPRELRTGTGTVLGLVLVKILRCLSDSAAGSR